MNGAMDTIIKGSSRCTFQRLGCPCFRHTHRDAPTFKITQVPLTAALSLLGARSFSRLSYGLPNQSISILPSLSFSHEI